MQVTALRTKVGASCAHAAHRHAGACGGCQLSPCVPGQATLESRRRQTRPVGDALQCFAGELALNRVDSVDAYGRACSRWRCRRWAGAARRVGVAVKTGLASVLSSRPKRHAKVRGQARVSVQAMALEQVLSRWSVGKMVIDTLFQRHLSRHSHGKLWKPLMKHRDRKNRGADQYTAPTWG